ncbi:MAG: serine O-acetyltransferase [Porticoccaceae bacterium]|jgi:serine O-acetyltransferase|nr:serine O-acetyltransferase [Porticoccaceae bacterium]
MQDSDPIWDIIVEEAQQAAVEEPVLEAFFRASVLNHASLDGALSYNLAEQLGSPAVPSATIAEVIAQALREDTSIGQSIRLDIRASFERDAACDRHLTPILYFKGFQALQLQRVSHWLWHQGRPALALFFQNQISETFAVDIHPGAQMGSGIMIDHATGLVIGETAVIGNDVSILHSVTLGGSGCKGGNRHPHIGDGVMISAGAKILGNITVGDGVKIGAGSLVLEDVPAHVTVAGVPAKIVGRPSEQAPALEMDQNLEVHP